MSDNAQKPLPLPVIQKLIKERYPQAKAVFWAGSVVHNQCTTTSDLDLIIVFEHLDYAYREAFIYENWPIDAFIHSPESLCYFFDESRTESGIPGLISMILNGQEVTESTVFSHQIKNVAYEYWELGPVAWEEDTIDKERFLITDLLEDIQSPVNKSEQIASAVALFVKLGNFYFRAKSKWCASNKSLIRYLELDNPELAATFIKSFDAVFQLGDAKQLIILVQKILAPYGGILWDGFRASASKLFRASGISYSEQKTKSIVVSKLHAPHYKWGQQCEGWWLKKDSKFTVISEIMPPGSWEIKHYHHVADQFFYVLEGYLSIFLNEQEYQLGRHQGISIPAKTIHQVLNKSEHEVKFLVISCPDSHGDREEIQST